jgi:hypothetical protein
MTEEAPKLRSVDSAQEPSKPRTPTSPSFLATLEELQGGTLPAILTRVLADTAMAVAEHASGKQKGKILLEFNITRGKGQFQLELSHRIAYAHPTVRGKKTEEMLKLIGTKVEVKLNTVERCSGHAGTYGVKTPTHPVAMKIGKPVFKAMAANPPDVIGVNATLPDFISTTRPSVSATWISSA